MRVTKDNAAILLFAQAPFDKILAASNLKYFRYEWIWEKSHATGFMNSKRMPLKNHEQVLVFYKKLPYYSPVMTKGKKVEVIAARRKKPVYAEIWDKDIKLYDYISDERYPKSVLKFKADMPKENRHPTQKPVKLVEYFLKTYTKPGDVILDPFSGSGTLAAACETLGDRRYICIEKEKKYYDQSLARIAKLKDDLSR